MKQLGVPLPHVGRIGLAVAAVTASRGLDVFIDTYDFNGRGLGGSLVGEAFQGVAQAIASNPSDPPDLRGDTSR
jgi:hypothetical protein